MTTKYYIHTSKKEVRTVYVRLSLGRGNDFRASTKQTLLNGIKWDDTNAMPKRNTDNGKVLYNKLHLLREFLETQIQQTESIISSRWLSEQINNYCNPRAKDTFQGFLKDHIQAMTKGYYRRSGIKIQYSKGTVSKYDNLLQWINRYHKKEIPLHLVGMQFADNFLHYLTDQKLSINTRGQLIRLLKTILNKASAAGKTVAPDYMQIIGFSDQATPIYLTEPEIQRIQNITFPESRLEIAKDWLIIGCYTGQRHSDLFTMDIDNIYKVKGNNHIKVKQQKTKKTVSVPILPEVEKVMSKYNDDFPPNLNDNEKTNRTLLNKHIKEVCRISGITKEIAGKLNGRPGQYPKCMLIQSHTFRRSFACNFYTVRNWPQSVVMAITGHTTEKNFFRYIDMQNTYLSDQALQMVQRPEQTTHLKTVG